MLLLLDIDGVMVPAAGWKVPENLDDGFPMFSKKAVDALTLLLAPDTEVVLTTSHKMRYSLNEWKAIFKRRGIELKNLSRLEIDKISIQRKDVLMDWFASQNINEDFIIIDDDT